jgi:hypothetical protein
MSLTDMSTVYANPPPGETLGPGGRVTALRAAPETPPPDGRSVAGVDQDQLSRRPDNPGQPQHRRHLAPDSDAGLEPPSGAAIPGQVRGANLDIIA